MAVAVAAVLVSACGSATREAPPIGQPPAVVSPDGELVGALSGEVSETGALAHLRALQEIADRNGGNRASPGPGYDASVDYVVGVVDAAGLDVTTPSYEPPDEEGTGGDGSLRNVIAQTRNGDTGQVVVVGAHLDSVREGPGMVDNGSGVAILLEIATRLSASPPPRNAIRFAFFGSEEEGLVGSTSYLDGLSADDRRKIKLYLNVDMAASPNAGYFVQGGKGDDAATAGPPGSAAVARVLADRMSRTVPGPETIEFVGDDESPFVEAGIPSGGAENGDSGTKSEDQARRWGGQPGLAFDRCYHAACDRLDNVNTVVLNNYLRTVAGTVAHFATSGEGLPR
ncbi:M20/M25/M40 family metallo-hydrolase [Pseudonocardia sediminis]|uniref:M20/M25/M40 family metallo-hydrolase n=1 Tax=Pseudonocardia sediminis TaxID=1397368 RepID=UPI001F5F98F9|nr:M20/M25/M40 family metallo-hydrolase [Pseudonocardia sediminis]